MNRFVGIFSAAVLAAGSGALLAQSGMGVIRLDQDGDGMISRAEFQLPQEPRGRGPMARADSDGDGAVTRAEMEVAVDEAIAERTEMMRAHMTGMFTDMDADGDGVVTSDEAADHAFARLDADGDGLITEAEARDRPRGPHGGKGRPGRPGQGPGQGPESR